MKYNLNTLFNPQHIAVIWASSKKWKIGYEILSNFIKSKITSDIYPINLKTESILWITTYKSIKAVPSNSVDLVVISIPSKYVIEAIRECITTWTKNIIIISAWFKEIWRIKNFL